MENKNRKIMVEEKLEDSGKLKEVPFEKIEEFKKKFTPEAIKEFINVLAEYAALSTESTQISDLTEKLDEKDRKQQLDFLLSDIARIDITVRTYNALKANEVKRVLEILYINDLLKLRNFGKKSLKELEDLFLSYKLDFYNTPINLIEEAYVMLQQIHKEEHERNNLNESQKKFNQITFLKENLKKSLDGYIHYPYSGIETIFEKQFSNIGALADQLKKPYSYALLKNRIPILQFYDLKKEFFNHGLDCFAVPDELIEEAKKEII